MDGEPRTCWFSLAPREGKAPGVYNTTLVSPFYHGNCVRSWFNQGRFGAVK
jgi:hypothetical protein